MAIKIAVAEICKKVLFRHMSGMPLMINFCGVPEFLVDDLLSLQIVRVDKTTYRCIPKGRYPLAAVLPLRLDNDIFCGNSYRNRSAESYWQQGASAGTAE